MSGIEPKRYYSTQFPQQEPIRQTEIKTCRVCKKIATEIFAVSQGYTSVFYFCKPACWTIYKSNRDFFHTKMKT